VEVDYPPGSPCVFDHWDEMLTKLDETCQRLRIKLSPDSEAMWQLERIRQEFVHVARYARDGESGQRGLLDELARAQRENERLRSTAQMADALLAKVTINGMTWTEYKAELEHLALDQPPATPTPEEERP